MIPDRKGVKSPPTNYPAEVYLCDDRTAVMSTVNPRVILVIYECLRGAIR